MNKLFHDKVSIGQLFIIKQYKEHYVVNIDITIFDKHIYIMCSISDRRFHCKYQEILCLYWGCIDYGLEYAVYYWMISFDCFMTTIIAVATTYYIADLLSFSVYRFTTIGRLYHSCLTNIGTSCFSRGHYFEWYWTHKLVLHSKKTFHSIDRSALFS